MLVSGDDPICFFVCFWKVELQPQNGRFFIILSDCIGFPGNGHFRHFVECCHFSIVCLFVCFFCFFVFAFLHRIRPHVVLVVDGVEYQVDVIVAVFNPTPDKFKPEVFSAVQIYDFTIYCKSALEFVMKKGEKNINPHARDSRG